MMGFDLGLGAFTTASHVVLILVLLLVFHEAQLLMRMQGSFAMIANSTYVRWSVFCVLSALIMERLYYVLARLLRGHGIDLWQAHPAPEFLSACVAGALFGLSAAGRIAVSNHYSEVLQPIMRNAILLSIVYAIVAAVLY